MACCGASRRSLNCRTRQSVRGSQLDGAKLLKIPRRSRAERQDRWPAKYHERVGHELQKIISFEMVGVNLDRLVGILNLVSTSTVA